MELLATPLGWIMKGCYMLVKNYGIALLLFTVVTRLITLPLQIKQQKSMTRMNMIQPELEKLKKKYGKNQEKLNEETMRLYSEYQINPMASCLPMIVTLVLLWALIPVVYGPLTYISGAEKSEVAAANNMVKNIYTISAEVDSKDTTVDEIIASLDADEDKLAAELVEVLSNEEEYKNSAKVMESLSGGDAEKLAQKFVDFEGLDKFIIDPDNFTQNVMSSAYGPEVLLFNFETKADGRYFNVLDENIRKEIADFNYTFFGMELGKIPTSKDATVIIPWASFILQLVTTIISQIFSKKNNPAMKLNGSMLAMLILMPLLSLWIGFKFPCALGIYWIYSSLFAVFQVIFLNIFYSPERLKVLAEKETEKAKAKRKKKGPSFMERAIELRNEQNPQPASSKRRYSDDDDDDEEDSGESLKKLSKSQIKEQNRQKLNEARRRYAEKYGDEYTEE